MEPLRISHKTHGYHESEMPPTTESRLRDLERKMDLLLDRFDRHETWAGVKATEFTLAKDASEKTSNEFATARSNVKLLLAIGALASAFIGWLVGFWTKR